MTRFALNFRTPEEIDEMAVEYGERVEAARARDERNAAIEAVRDAWAALVPHLEAFDNAVIAAGAHDDADAERWKRLQMAIRRDQVVDSVDGGIAGGLW